MKPMAWMTAISENTMPTAPAALVPSCATKNVSAILYTAVTSMLMMVGTASVATSLGMGVCVIFRYWASPPGRSAHAFSPSGFISGYFS